MCQNQIRPTLKGHPHGTDGLGVVQWPSDSLLVKLIDSSPDSLPPGKGSCLVYDGRDLQRERRGPKAAQAFLMFT